MIDVRSLATGERLLMLVVCFILLLSVPAASISPTETMLFENGHVRKWSAQSLEDAVRAGECTLVLVGAVWDGHFRHFVGHHYWQSLAAAVSSDTRLTVGAMLYNEEDLPWLANASSGQKIWDKSIGSYDVRLFGKGGKLLEGDNMRIHRSAFWRDGKRVVKSDFEYLTDAYSSCSSDPQFFSFSED